eukprot:s5430_g3.t1
MDRRTEEVSQVQRSLNFMTGLLTSLTDRVGRMEQWQSATGSTAGGGAASVGASSAMTPMTPQAQQSGWADVDQLNQQLLSLRMGDGSEGADPRMMMRPLTSTARILEGTFSSDSSETARRRAEEAQRGVPGALLGPLALADRPFFLEGDPMAVVQERGDGTQAVGAVVDQTVEAIMRSHAQDGLEPSSLGIAGPQNTSSLPRTTESQSMYLAVLGYVRATAVDGGVLSEYASFAAGYGVFGYAQAFDEYGASEYRVVFEEYGVLESAAGVGLSSMCRWMSQYDAYLT